MVFVHFEGAPAYTMKVKDTSEFSLAKFVKKYEAKGGRLRGDLELRDASGRKIAALENLEPKADVFVVLKNPVVEAVVEEKKDEPQKETAPTRRRRTVEREKKGISEEPLRVLSGQEERLIRDRVADGQKLLAKKQYREASKAFESALEVHDQSRAAHKGLGETYLKVGDVKRAINEFEKCLVGGDPAEEANAYHDLARAYEAQGDYAQCVKTCQAALLKGKQPSKRKELFDAAGTVTTLSWGLVKMRAAGDAVSLIEGVLAKNDKEPRAIRCYAAIAARAEKWEEELSLLLRAVIFAQNDELLREDLANAIDRPGGVARLKKQLSHSDAGAASAVAFLATVCKDKGKCWLAVKLLEWAATEDPKHGGYALNLLHAYEIVNENDKAFQVGLHFFKNTPKKSLGGLEARKIMAILTSFFATSESDVVPLEWIPDRNDATQQYGHAKRKGTPTLEPRPKTQYDDEALDALGMVFALTKIAFLAGKPSVASRLVEAVEPARRASRTPLHETNTRNEHAYYSCVAQLLCVDPKRSASTGTLNVYVCGDSHALAPAWKSWDLGDGESLVLKPALVTGLKHWHLRPETQFYPKHNLYSVLGLDATTSPEKVCKALGLPTSPSPSEPNQKQGIVPKGATVIFLFGEIDCREGILVAVSKLRYKDLDDGIAKTAQLFINAAEIIVQDRQYKAYVHPIPSVLNETRSIVKKYNARLHRLVDASPHLTWLDFFDPLLTPDHNLLLPKYRLDGTHLHPSYLDDLLRDALLADLRPGFSPPTIASLD